jgi:small subunit ribosomal protein S2
MYYIVERWLGGTLTNYGTIKKSIKRLLILEKESSEIYTNLTKKELSMLERERVKLADLHRGIKDMKHLPKALFFVDGIHERIAISEAKNLGIPTFGIVDSNTDPRNIDFPIPANDDSMKTISLIVNYICDTIIEATGGTAQAEESLESENVPEEESAIDKQKSADDIKETKDDSKTIPEKELELVAEDKAASEDAQKENQE